MHVVDRLSRSRPGVGDQPVAGVGDARHAGVGDDEHALTGLRASGETFPLEASVSCLQLDSERVYTVIGRDVSERKRQEEELRSAVEHLT